LKVEKDDTLKAVYLCLIVQYKIRSTERRIVLKHLDLNPYSNKFSQIIQHFNSWYNRRRKARYVTEI